MMRKVLFVLLVAGAPRLFADDPTTPAQPQAVKALEHLQAQPSAGPFSWTAGAYRYDGAGNITDIGGESFVYDKVGRLRSATVRGPDLSAMQTQTFHYDPYGNLISTSKLGQTIPLSVDSSTNRLEGLTYDPAGYVTISGAQHYAYDALGMMNAVSIGPDVQPRMVYAYTADDERLFSYDVATGTTHWTLRGLDNKVLRDFKQQGSTWSVERDYVNRDGLLLAAIKAGGAIEHYTLDHLGTPRLITDTGGRKLGVHAYWPFGEEWSPGNAQEGMPLQFTGHERDADPMGGAAPLDYMHARYYRAGWGRFLSVDPILPIDAMRSPQLWNRYAYVGNNPMNRMDPTGKILQLAGSAADLAKMEQIANGGLHGYRLSISDKGIASLEKVKVKGKETKEQKALREGLQKVIGDKATTSINVASGARGVVIGQFNMRTVDPRTFDVTSVTRIPVP
jgi:RHS repeat-associated protein